MSISRKWQRLTALLALALVLIAAGAWLRENLVIRLKVDDDVRLALRGAVPFRTSIEQGVAVSIDEQIQTKVKLGTFTIDLNEHVDVPLRMKLEVPIDADMRVNQPIDLSLDVPIDTVLTEKELDLNQLTIPIDQDVFIDDAIEVNVVVPVDTTVTTSLGVRLPVKTRVPVKMKVPIKQKLHVQDSLKLKLKGVRVPLKMLVPVRMRMPLDQSFRVRGTITAPVDQVVRVPLRKTIAPAMREDVQVAVQLSGKLPAKIKATFDSSVRIDDTITTRLEPLRISARDVTLHVAEGR